MGVDIHDGLFSSRITYCCGKEFFLKQSRATSGPPSHGRRRRAAPPDRRHRHDAAARTHPHTLAHIHTHRRHEPTAETRRKERRQGARERARGKKNVESQGKQETGAFYIVADAHTASTVTEPEHTGVPTPNADTPAHDAGPTHPPSSPSQRVHRPWNAPPPAHAPQVQLALALHLCIPPRPRARELTLIRLRRGCERELS
ncbi:hypothetical protein DFH09DRAFT_35992 [Mycena vulgaris]|nr:hypothetical protein DFH09DRAFT_35992 [Mycena vulgaris]